MSKRNTQSNLWYFFGNRLFPVSFPLTTLCELAPSFPLGKKRRESSKRNCSFSACTVIFHTVYATVTFSATWRFSTMALSDLKILRHSRFYYGAFWLQNSEAQSQQVADQPKRGENGNRVWEPEKEKENEEDECGPWRERIYVEPSWTSGLCLGVTQHPSDKAHAWLMMLLWLHEKYSSSFAGSSICSKTTGATTKCCWRLWKEGWAKVEKQRQYGHQT